MVFKPQTFTPKPLRAPADQQTDQESSSIQPVPTEISQNSSNLLQTQDPPLLKKVVMGRKRMNTRPNLMIYGGGGDSPVVEPEKTTTSHLLNETEMTVTDSQKVINLQDLGKSKFPSIKSVKQAEGDDVKDL